MESGIAQVVLIADDDTGLCEMLSEYFSDAAIETSAVHDGEAALRAVRSGHFGLLILDVMLPGLNGFEVLKQLRRESSIPVLMLTAKGDETDRIVGLELGADDYLPKPFNPRELLARTRAILRRHDAEPFTPQSLIRTGTLELNLGAQTAVCSGRELVLTSTEFRLLTLLTRCAGKIVSRDELSEYGLGRNYQPLDRSIDTHLSNVRKKIAAACTDGLAIKNIRGRGYILTLPGVS